MDHTELFLSTLDETADNFFFQTFDDSSKKDPHLVRTMHAPLEDVRSDLQAMNDQGAGIFVCINRLRTPKRTNDNVSEVRAVFVDLDGAPLQPVVLGGGLAPHMVINSGGGPDHYHAYWLVDGLPLEEFAPIQRALAAQFKADPKVCDLARVMRLPGFRNKKHGTPGSMCYPIVEEMQAIPPYSPDAIRKLANVAANVPPAVERSAGDMAKSEDPIPNGQRNDTLFRIGCYYAGEGKSRSYIANRLADANENRCNPPVSEPELALIISQSFKAEHDKLGELPGPEVEADAKVGYTWDDMGNARKMYDMFGYRFKRLRSGSESWVVLDPDTNMWSPKNDDEVLHFAQSVGDSLLEEFRALELRVPSEPDLEDLVDKLKPHVKKSRNINGLKGMIAVYAGLPEAAIDLPAFDADPLSLCVKNGIVDLNEMSIRPIKPDDYVSKRCDVDYIPSADCPLWENFVLECCGGDYETADYVQRAVGYSLTGSTKEHLFFMVIGPGGNGKSVFLDVLYRMLGGYGYASNASVFQTQTNSINFSLHQLAGARMVTAPEVNNRRAMAESTVKQLTGGDYMTASVKNKPDITFKFIGKIWITGNSYPIVGDMSDGMWRRIQVVPFDNHVPASKIDRDLTEKLLATRDGILQWCMQGYRKYRTHGLGAPPAVLEANARYREDSDTIMEWMNECVSATEGDIGHEVKYSDMFAHYCEWCGNGKVSPKPQGKHEFYARLRKNYPIGPRASQEMTYKLQRTPYVTGVTLGRT